MRERGGGFVLACSFLLFFLVFLGRGGGFKGKRGGRRRKGEGGDFDFSFLSYLPCTTANQPPPFFLPTYLGRNAQPSLLHGQHQLPRARDHVHGQLDLGDGNRVAGHGFRAAQRQLRGAEHLPADQPLVVAGPFLLILILVLFVVPLDAPPRLVRAPRAPLRPAFPPLRSGLLPLGRLPRARGHAAGAQPGASAGVRARTDGRARGRPLVRPAAHVRGPQLRSGQHGRLGR